MRVTNKAHMLSQRNFFNTLFFPHPNGKLKSYRSMEKETPECNFLFQCHLGSAPCVSRRRDPSCPRLFLLGRLVLVMVCPSC